MPFGQYFTAIGLTFVQIVGDLEFVDPVLREMKFFLVLVTLTIFYREYDYFLLKVFVIKTYILYVKYKSY